jgi:DNA repair protein RadC
MNEKLLLQRFSLRREEVSIPGLVKKQYRRAEELVELIRELTKDEVQEVSLAFFLDSQFQLLGYMELARGGLDWVRWDRRVMFAAALQCGATQIVLSHNHPSGIAKPSRADVANMKHLIPAAEMLHLSVLDHVVVSPTQSVSMNEYGLLPPRSELLRNADRRREEVLDAQALNEEEP